MREFSAKSRIGGSDVKESACKAGNLGLFPGSANPLEKEMATHSNILAISFSRGFSDSGIKSRSPELQADSLPSEQPTPVFLSFPCSSVSKESGSNAGDLGLSSGSGRSPGEGNGNPLQYSCLENSMDRGAW